MSNSMSNLLNNERLWKYLGLGSYMIGFSCFVFSVYWKDAFGETNLAKIILFSMYGMAVYICSTSLLTVHNKSLWNMMVITYARLFRFTFLYDQYHEEGKPEMGNIRILSLISRGAFTLTSLSLLRQVALELRLPGMLSFLSNAVSDIINHPMFWRHLGFGSTIVGFSCYAFTPTFKSMFGEWNWWKIAIYIVVSSILPCILLFVKELGSKKNFILKANVCFLVFLGTCVYSYYQDRSEGGKNESDYGRMLSMFSFGGFALMSLSLSRLTNIGFEMGVSSFFLTGFFTCAIKINLQVATAIALICYVVFYIRSISDSMLEMQGGDTEHVILEIDSLSLIDTGSITENFRSDLDSQLELSDVVDHGNQRTEADNSNL